MGTGKMGSSSPYPYNEGRSFNSDIASVDINDDHGWWSYDNPNFGAKVDDGANIFDDLDAVSDDVWCWFGNTSSRQSLMQLCQNVFIEHFYCRKKS